MANINEHVEYIFDTLIGRTSDQKVKSDKGKFRPQDAEPDEQKKFRSFNSLSNFKPLPNLKACSFKSGETLFFAVNLNEIALDNQIYTGMFEQEISEADFLYVAKTLELEVKSVITEEVLLEEVLYQPQSSEYEGHSLKELIPYFDNFCIIQIPREHVSSSFEIERLSYFILSSVNSLIPLPINEVGYKYIELLANTKNQPVQNIFMSLTSTHWKHAFLELYRCIEGLYILPYGIELKTEISYSGKAITLARQCVNKLKWRRKEEASLKKLFEHTLPKLESQGIISSTSYLNSITNINFSKISEKIYLLRNNLVHQTDNEQVLTDDEWRELLALLLNKIEIIYEDFATEV